MTTTNLLSNFSPNTPLGRAIAEYTGLTVVSLSVVPDPTTEGTWAIQAVIVNGDNQPLETGTIQFLLTGFASPRFLSSVTADDLSECEFTTWPPKARL